MSDAAWQRHVALARYYEMLLGLYDSSDPRVAKVLTSRQVEPGSVIAQMKAVVEALETGKDTFTGRRRVRAAYVSAADGLGPAIRLLRARDYDAKRAWPLVLRLHGAGG